MLGGVANSYFFNPSAARMLVLLVESKLALPCCVAFVFFMLPMLGGVANSDFLNPSAARMLILVLGDLVLRPPIFQLPLRCGVLFYNTWTAMPTCSASMGTNCDTCS